MEISNIILSCQQLQIFIPFKMLMNNTTKEG